MATGFGLSGQAFVGADIGGFQGNSNAGAVPALDAVRHADARSAATTPRSATSTSTPGPWARWSSDLVRAAIGLRYRLMPYIYAAFLRASETGAPVQRPLVFDHQYDPLVRDLDDQYLFGPDLLVAPVTEPGTTAAPGLPAGGRLVRLAHRRGRSAGSGSSSPPTPMDRIPLYARGGAVIPMWPQAPASTAGHHPEVIELHVFVPPADGSHRSLLAGGRRPDLRRRATAPATAPTFTLTRAATGRRWRGRRRRRLPRVRPAGLPARRARAQPASVRLDGADPHAADGAFALPNARSRHGGRDRPLTLAHVRGWCSPR